MASLPIGQHRLNTRQLAFAGIFASLLTSGSASALTLQVDLDTSLGFFINPNPNYSVAVTPASPISYTPGDTLNIAVEFVDLDGSGGQGIGADQFLQVFDLTQQVGQDPDPPQDINVFLGGNMPSGLSNLSFQIEFTGVSGTISGTTFSSASAFCNPGVFCSSGVMGADLINAAGQDASFSYHDFHIMFSTAADPNIAAFDINSISFGGAADQVSVNVSSVPEPGTLALFAFGLAALAVPRRRRP